MQQPFLPLALICIFKYLELTHTVLWLAPVPFALVRYAQKTEALLSYQLLHLVIAHDPQCFAKTLGL